MSRVLITGCSSGIGRALVVELARRGHEVVATARREAALAGLPAALTLALDVDQASSVAAVRDQVGDIDVLVNNAGITAWGPIELLDMADVEAVFQTNVLGVVRMVQAFVPGMRLRGSGLVVNVSSIAGRGGGSPFLGLYAASKVALETISEALRVELACFGVRVTVVEPGGVESSFGDNRRMTDTSRSAYDELMERHRALIEDRRRRAMSSEEAANEIADVIEMGAPPLRVPIGEDARSRLEDTTERDRAREETALANLLAAGRTP